jgi:hypothetical protein
MKKENKQMLKLILSNQELIMKALNVPSPSLKVEKSNNGKAIEKKVATKKAATKKMATKKAASKKAITKKTTKTR